MDRIILNSAVSNPYKLVNPGDDFVHDVAKDDRLAIFLGIFPALREAEILFLFRSTSQLIEYQQLSGALGTIEIYV
jgi:hypothetical protein